MNNPHRNARATVHGREQIVARITVGRTAAGMAEAFGVSVCTVCKWVARQRAGGRAALGNGASASTRVVRRLPEAVVRLILWLRRRLRLTAARIAALLGPAPSGPPAKPSGSFRPFCASGAVAWRTPHRTPATLTCPAGLTGSTDQDRTLHSTTSHPSKVRTTL